MPELPEVETFRAILTPQLSGRAITDLALFCPKVVAHPSAEVFRDGVCGRTIRELDRRGKFLIARLADGTELIAHLRMTGRLLATPRPSALAAHALRIPSERWQRAALR